MPREAHRAFLREKNRPETAAVNLYSLEFPDETLRFAERDKDVHFGGYHWRASGIRREEIRVTAPGTVTKTRITVPDPSGAIWTWLLLHRATVPKQLTVGIHLVWADQLHQPDAIMTDRFKVLNSARKGIGIAVELENPTVFDDILPRHFFSKRHCRFTFGDPLCGHPAPAEESCARTLADCIRLNNRQRFGGCPAMVDKWR